MKRYGNLYPKMWDLDNIKLAHKNARKGKTHYQEVQMVNADAGAHAGAFYLSVISASSNADQSIGARLAF